MKTIATSSHTISFSHLSFGKTKITNIAFIAIQERGESID